MGKSFSERTLSWGQMEALSALCDALLPSVQVSFDSDDSVAEFYRTSASMAGTPSRVGVMLQEKVKHPKIYLTKVALNLLSTRIGTFILCGRRSLSPEFPYFQKVSKLSSRKREEILRSWSNSCFSLLRILYAGLKIIALLVFFTQVNQKDENISWKAIGYCGPDPAHITRKPKPNITQQFRNEAPEEPEDKADHSTEEELFGPLYKGIINLNQPREIAFAKLQDFGFPVSTPHSRKTRIKSLSPSFIIKCDAVVIGSGSGGGVVAGILAKAGHKVLVLEKGSYSARSNVSLLEGQAMEQMYLSNGILGTNNMDVLLLAGSTVGGGSTINWSASIRTPPNVRKEWSEIHKLGFFDSEKYEKALDVVCRKMGVQSEIQREGFNSMVLRKGCENLGYPVENVPQNAPSDHYCGWCCLGCKNGSKKGTSETWLVDLVESGNGVILPECEAIKVITSKTEEKTKAVGVAFEFQHQGIKEVAIIESRVTVTACGAICTPEVLKRSGLKNPNIGRNLHLHPVVMAWGYFPEAGSPSPWPVAEIRSYEGGILTAMSKVSANQEGSGYGVIIQTPSLHPGMFSALMPWISGSDIKNRMLKFPRTAHVFALARDKSSGVVHSPTDISYEIDSFDQENLSEGIEKVLRILAAAGAEEIGTHHREGRVLKVKEVGVDEFEKFVREESLRPMKKLSMPLCSAHQMGSCRMGVDPKRSVVGPKGETWEVEGLFIADSSVFPTALGVNPMVTIQAIAYCTAQSVLEVLERNGWSKQ